MIETRLKEIFDYLTEDYSYHSSNELAEKMNLSSKTIRKEVNTLNLRIKDKGAFIQSKPGKGYKFVIEDEDKFKSFLKNDWYKIAYYQQESGNRELRYDEIIKLFLFSNTFIKQNELAEMFHLSESQINKDIPVIREKLKKYGLDLISKPYYGMKIEGKEKDTRLAMKNEIGEDPEIFEQDKDNEIFRKVEDIIEDIDFGENYYTPYANFKNLVIHIYISILRIKQKKYVTFSSDIKNKVISYEEFTIANKIVDRLQKDLGISVPYEELVYITMHLIAKNTITDQEKLSFEILNLSEKIIEEIYEVSKYDFRENLNLYFSLATHLGPLINRIRYGFDMKNPILEDIKNNKVAFLLATIGADVINTKYKSKISEDEIGYIALHIMAAIESNKKSKFNILLVCGSGNSSAQIMKAQLLSQFSDAINKIKIVDLREFNNRDTISYDFIISSVQIDKKVDKPIIYVDIIFTKSDISSIKSAFEVENLDVINKIFENSVFIKDLNIQNKEEALVKIADLISNKSSMDRNEALNQLKHREKLGFTSYDKVAIPHMLENIDGESFAIIIVLKKPIKWDDNEVSLIYSLSIGDKLGDMNLYYKKLGDFLSNPDLIELACSARDSNEFMNIFMD